MFINAAKFRSGEGRRLLLNVAEIIVRAANEDHFQLEILYVFIVIDRLTENYSMSTLQRRIKQNGRNFFNVVDLIFVVDDSERLTIRFCLFRSTSKGTRLRMKRT